MDDFDLSPQELDLLSTLKDPDDSTKSAAQYDFDKSVQQDILSLMLHERSFMVQSMHLIRSEYFADKAHILICKILTDWFSHHIKHITGEGEKWIQAKYIRDQLLTELKENPARSHYLAELQTILDCYVQGLTSRSYCMEKVVNFAKDQEIRLAVSKTMDIVKGSRDRDRYDKIKHLWDKAFMVGPQMDIGLNYFEDIEERYKRMAEDRSGKDRFSSGFDEIDQGIVGGGLSRGEIAGYEAMSGAGKSFRRDTPILMFDGTIRMVQDVKVDDLVMGVDSKPRKVVSTHQGLDEMFQVTPIKGDPYVVNSEHILCLKSCSNKNRNGYLHHPSRVEGTDYYCISVKDFLSQSKNFQENMKGWRVGVDFQAREVKIDPYFLGVWLGDGTQRDTQITTADKEIVEIINKEAAERFLYVTKAEKGSSKASGYTVSGGREKLNSLLVDLRFYDLINNKHVPYDYKVNSREVRLQVLAGLIDTDGSESHGCYDFVNKNKELAYDFAFLARSLGLAAYVKPCRKQCKNNGVWGEYWRVLVSGDCSEIPVRIPRKKCKPRRQIKNHLVHGIKVESIGVGAYYGFEVDVDNLFLLGDFTVVHNSWMLCKASISNVRLGHKVLLVTLEMNQDKTAERFDTLFTGINMDNLLKEEKLVKRKLDVEIKTALANLEALIGNDKNRLMIKHFSAGTADVNTVRAYYSQLALHGFKPDILLVDYIGEFKDFPGMKTYESRQRMMRDLRSFGEEEDHCTLTALQANRAGRQAQDGGFLDDSEISESFGQVRNMDACWSINQTKKEKMANVGRIFVVKNRNGKSRYHFCYHQDHHTLAIRSISDEEFKDKVSAVKELKESPMGAFEIENASKFMPNGEE